MTQIPKPRKKKFYKKFWFWILVILFLLVGSCTGGSYYLSSKFGAESGETFQETATAEKRALAKTVTTEGEIKSKKTNDLYFGAQGQVTEVHVSIGDAVTGGQLLAKIDATAYATTAQQEVKAPFDGIVTDIGLDDGELISPQEVAVTIESQETEIVAYVAESEVLDLESGQKATISFSSLNGISLKAVITTVAETKKVAGATTGQATSSSGYEVKLDYDKPVDLVIKRDMSCDIDIKVATKDDALSVPIAAVQWDEDQAYVETVLDAKESSEAITAKKEVADKATKKVSGGKRAGGVIMGAMRSAGSKDSTAKTFYGRKEIELGFEGDEYVEVLSGLKEGEEIVLFSFGSDAKSFGLK